MKPAAGATGCVLGYDPGGNHAHGLAILEVVRQGDLWAPHETAMAADCADVHDALRGLNRQWTHDLHEEARASESHPFGRTHYWWPQVKQ